MTKKKTKKISIIAAAVLVVVLPTAALLIYNYFYNKNYSNLATATLAEIAADSKLPDKEYSNLDFSEAVLSIPENLTALHSYYRLNDPNIYSPEECDAAFWDLLFKPFGLDPDDISTFKDENRNQVGSVSYVHYSGLETIFVQPYESIYDDERGYAHGYCITNVSEEKKDGDWIYYCSFERAGGIYTLSYRSAIKQSQDIVEEIHLDRGEELHDKAYLVNGVEYTPRQAVEFAQNSISLVEKYLRSDKLVPSTVVVIKNVDDDYYSYDVLFEYQLDGVPMLDAQPAAVNLFDTKYNLSSSHFVVSICDPNEVGGIFNLSAYAIVGHDGELKDKYIPLDKAIESLHQYFAPNYVQKISDVSIKYAIKYDLDGNTLLDDDAKIYARPYWCFTKSDGNYYEPGLHSRVEVSILVDMQTGEIISYDPNTNCYISSFDE